ncbi:single-stranded DNA-binding protein [Candidatus Saccharibacteria bacterium]|nr:single-stranded DNA-binding protein [Candidatus Saccharibacteria bacterium]
MAKDFNQAIVMGNLTRDPELRTTPSGQSVASFAVATNRSWQDPSGERKDAVEYHDIVAWGKLGELASSYLQKGRKVLVVGRLQTRSWEGNDGVKRQKTEIVATDINFVDRMNAGGDAGSDAGFNQDPDAQAPAKPATKKDGVKIEDMGDGDINLDDIPF